jgi:HEAT repeat protein
VSTDLTPAELAEMARHDLDFSARIWALKELEGKRDSAAVEARRFIVLNEPQWWLRSQALLQMAGDQGPASMDAARSALRDPDSHVRSRALQTLATLDSAGAGPLAKGMFDSDPNFAVRANALQVYARDRSPDALPALIAATAVGLPTGLRQTAAALLSGYKDAQATEALERLTATAEPRNLRVEALNDVVKQGDAARAAALATRYLGDYDPLFAVAAVRALARVGGDTGKTTLRGALPKETRVTVRAAIQAGLNGSGS